MRERLRVGLWIVVCSIGLAAPVLANPPSGAIFTTVEDGSEVNFNHYPSKEAVYLDGGPGPGAPQPPAGLDDGRYVFRSPIRAGSGCSRPMPPCAASSTWPTASSPTSSPPAASTIPESTSITAR